ncbi:DNA replication and repair protein RecF [Synergistaceae bacterium OttesenSCG-928-D05]|nr:DNA replication and repair protein RecF [Synergistaceae bacterium OttesenSCG-928-D05]
MGFSRVRFNNFRNIEPREMKWSPGLNLLMGENGSGKTNILEGINILSGWGPLERGTKTASLPTWESGSEDVQLTGQLDDESGDIVKVKISGRCTMRFNDKSINATDLRWRVPVLTFQPNDMAILEGSASYRRRLLDMILALIVPPYAVRLHDYRRGIKQKSVMLRKGMPTATVDRALLPLAAWIWKMRGDAVSLLSECLEPLEELLPAHVELSHCRGGGGLFDEPERDFMEAFSKNRFKECQMKVPLVGPHRDDLIINTGSRSASCAFSRGFRRRTAIALMLAASDAVKRKLGKNPVLLLDEVTAELDNEGRKVLFDALLQRGAQVFAATAEPGVDFFPGEVHRVSKGKVVQPDEN